MSMNATFVQVESLELARFQHDPSMAEVLFMGDMPIPEVFTKLSNDVAERVRNTGPQMLVDSLARLDPALKARLAERLGKSPDEWARSLGGDDLLKILQERQSRLAEQRQSARKTRPTLSLDKAWHGVHYLLCGEAEPGATLLSQAVLGGATIGPDDEGFSGYGPARYFTATQVAELAQALSQPGLESECAARFDPKRMSDLEIYPGWGAADAKWALDAFRRLRDFYADAAAGGRAIVTCLV
jgi:hypothetical protein